MVETKTDYFGYGIAAGLVAVSAIVGKAFVGFYLKDQEKLANSRRGLIADVSLYSPDIPDSEKLKNITVDCGMFRRAIFTADDRYEISISDPRVLAAAAEQVRNNAYAELLFACPFGAYLNKHPDGEQLKRAMFAAQADVTDPSKDVSVLPTGVHGQFLLPYLLAAA